MPLECDTTASVSTENLDGGTDDYGLLVQAQKFSKKPTMKIADFA
jgi:hypothetical protein